MRFGVGDFSAQRPPGTAAGHTQLYAEMVDQARLIEAVGIDSMWLSEHHFAEDGYMPAVLPIAGCLLGATSRLIVGTDRLAVSLHDPVRLAEDAVALDLLGGGRFVLGLSLCYRGEELAGFRVDPSSDVERLESVALFLRDAFAGRPATTGSRTVTVTPAPFSPGGPPIMVAADGEGGAARAARLADLLMVDPTEPRESLERAVVAFDAVRGDAEGGIVLFVYGALSEHGADAAWKEVADGFRYMRHNYDRWMGREATRELPPASYRLLLGTPAEVASQAVAYRDRYGERVHLVLRCNYPGMSAASVARQIGLWGEAAALVRKTV